MDMDEGQIGEAGVLESPWQKQRLWERGNITSHVQTRGRAMQRPRAAPGNAVEGSGASLGTERVYSSFPEVRVLYAEYSSN